MTLFHGTQNRDFSESSPLPKCLNSVFATKKVFMCVAPKLDTVYA